MTEPLEGQMTGTKGSEAVSTKLQRIAELARKGPKWVLTTLAHHIDIDFLREAWRRTRKDGASGVDGQTAQEYAEHLEENLGELLERFKSGTYRAPPVRRVYIPKADGRKQRPIGIPTLEDKVLQRAVTMVLEAVYEQDFEDCSYGFRPGRSAHDALASLRTSLMEMGGGWVLDVDIQDFFGSLVHPHLRTILDQRVRDGVLRRSIDKWLKAGVMEEGRVWRPETGSPQGGVVSPLLSNVYLHHVLDTWFEQEARPRMRGRVALIRYADDFVIVCAREDDARRLMDVLPKRFGRYGLTLHPEKTRLVQFVSPRRLGGSGQPETFNLLGFTHYWGKSRQGWWVVKRRTAKDRFARTVRKMAQWCRQNRHLSMHDQHKALCQKLRGHDQYFGVIGNYAALRELRLAVQRVWFKWLRRRSQRHRLNWPRFARWLVGHPLLAPRTGWSKSSAANP